MTEKGGQQLGFSFQIGLVKDKITVDVTDLTLKSLKTLAVSFVNEKFHEHEITRLGTTVPFAIILLICMSI